MIAGALLIVGFSEAADYGFSTPRAYAIIIVGAFFFCLSVAHFLTTKRVAIIPAVSLSGFYRLSHLSDIRPSGCSKIARPCSS